MFRQVLVPLDFTPKNEAAVAVARSVTTVDGTLTLLHVIERIGEETDGELDAFYARLEERSGERMTAMLAGLADAPFATRSRIVYGRRAQAIVEVARDLGCDLIVMSSHQIAPDRPASDWISISHKVAILAPCPILLVK